MPTKYVSPNVLKETEAYNLNTKKTSLGQYFKNGSRVVLKTSELFWKIYCSEGLENFEISDKKCP